MSEGKPLKRYALRALAVLLLLLSAAIFVLESHNFVIRSFGILVLLASVQIVRMSRAQNPSLGHVDLTASGGPGSVMWFVGVALLVLAGVSYWLMYLDAFHGGHAVWPVYLFAGVVSVGAGVWSYIVTKLVRLGS